eukprot:CAMPEP_0113925538 /NCGR_PEP_ID=MMETSP1159-20121227/3252_1 /TAXON_ID=88271 /ORGANISM="Picocystis salinarum" /LENGTH=352 /DNA_ID=CAMNT_0000925825 /DNA_START=38 /DNA_END=1093 /DNA_ORIENTATION=+ /assembly_acc=CAM_ASM_000767
MSLRAATKHTCVASGRPKVVEAGKRSGKTRTGGSRLIAEAHRNDWDSRCVPLKLRGTDARGVLGSVTTGGREICAMPCIRELGRTHQEKMKALEHARMEDTIEDTRSEFWADPKYPTVALLALMSVVVCRLLVGPTMSKKNGGLLSQTYLTEQEIVANQGPPPPSPMVMERFQSVISQLFQQRVIRVGGAVDDDMANLIVAQLLYLDSVDPKKDIVLYVNSPGGSVTAGMAIFDTMRHVRPDCATVCVGLAASMGAFLLASGHKGKRFSLPHSRIMIHQPLGGAQGQAADIEIQANEILHHKLTLNGYLAEFTGQSLEKITEDTDRDFFMSAAEAKEYGLIDEVILSPTAVS